MPVDCLGQAYPDRLRRIVGRLARGSEPQALACGTDFPVGQETYWKVCSTNGPLLVSAASFSRVAAGGMLSRDEAAGKHVWSYRCVRDAPYVAFDQIMVLTPEAARSSRTVKGKLGRGSDQDGTA